MIYYCKKCPYSDPCRGSGDPVARYYTATVATQVGTVANPSVVSHVLYCNCGDPGRDTGEPVLGSQKLYCNSKDPGRDSFKQVSCAPGIISQHWDLGRDRSEPVSFVPVIILHNTWDATNGFATVPTWAMFQYFQKTPKIFEPELM